MRFTRNQVRLSGGVGTPGALADVFLDDIKQFTRVNFHSPIAQEGQVVYHRNGLENGPHTLRLVARHAYTRASAGNHITVTVGPGTYHARLKFAETQCDSAGRRGISIFINGRKMVEGFDVFATAGGAHRAVDLVFDRVPPRNGVVDIRFLSAAARDAMVQAIQIAPGSGGEGAVPKTVH